MGSATFDPLPPCWEDGQNSITLNSLRQKAKGEGEDDDRIEERQRVEAEEWEVEKQQ